MRILLTNLPWEVRAVRAGSRWPHIKEIDPHYMPFPFFLAYSASLLQENGYEVIIIDALAERLNKAKYIRRIEKIQPDIILAETSTPSIKNDLKITEEIKNYTNSQIFLSGTHITIFPEQLLLENNHIDIILKGEYEFTLLDVLNCLKDDKDLKSVKGIAYRHNGEIVNTPERELISDLDLLPYPMRDQLPLEAYYDGLVGTPQIQMLASRGCPFKCGFCLWVHVLYKNKFRARNSKKVVDEMEYIKNNYRPKYIYFDDDTFNVGKKRVIDLCQQIIERGINIEWGCMAHSAIIDKEMLSKMYDAGCIGIKFGVESAVPSILKNVPKSTDINRIKNAFKWAKEFGIKTHATYTFGLPGDTKETIRETIDFAVKLNSDTAQFSITTPFPGTPFYEKYKNEGWLLYPEQWEKYDGSFTTVIQTPDLTVNDLEDLLIEAYTRFYHSNRCKRSLFDSFKQSLKKDGMVKTANRSINWLAENIRYRLRWKAP